MGRVPGHRTYCLCEDCKSDGRLPLGRSEKEKVQAFRLHRLMLAGYRLGYASQLALSDADWHKAVDLIDRGCPEPTAVEILL